MSCPAAGIKDTRYPSLSEFSGAEGKGGYNSITPDPSNLTDRINGIKSSECQSIRSTLPAQSMSYCSRFDSCSAPKCPLDPFIDRRSENDWDPVCGMAKPTRHRYWESMPEDLRDALPFQGYFEGEFRRIMAAKQRWESLSEEKKAEIRGRLKNVRPR